MRKKKRLQTSVMQTLDRALKGEPSVRTTELAPERIKVKSSGKEKAKKSKSSTKRKDQGNTKKNREDGDLEPNTDDRIGDTP